MQPNTYAVYILSNHSWTLYVGVSGDLERRILQHKDKLIPGFTSRYNLDRLVWFETTSNVEAAISREKQIKGWTRAKKIALIQASNPQWRDLSADWYAK